MLSPTEMRIWQTYCQMAVGICQVRANRHIQVGQKGRASWFLLGVQVWDQIGHIPGAAEQYVHLLEEWSNMPQDELFVAMCRYVGDSIEDHEHYFFLVMHRVADLYDGGDPGDEQPASDPTADDWIDRVFLDAVVSVRTRLEGHAEGCGCNACRAEARAFTAWFNEATS